MDETQGFKYIQDITLDLDCNGAYTTIAAKQGDNNSRIIKVHLTKNNIPYTIPSGVSAYFRCRKPDGHGVDAPAIINTEENVIEVTLTSQVLMVSGRAYCDVGFTGDGILSSSAFILLIMASPSIASGEVSTDDFTRLTETINDANIITTEAEAWATGQRGGTPVEPSAPQYNCNAFYFATEASKAFNSVKNIQVKALQSYISTEPTATTSFEDNHLLITFGLPAGDTGATGPQGPSTVFVSSEQPVAAIASQYNIWFNDEGEPEKFTITGNQVTYNADYSGYGINTVGKAIQTTNNAVSLLSQKLETSMDSIGKAIESANSAANRAEAAAVGIENKITNPSQGTTSGWHGYLKNEKTEGSSYKISWSSGIPYDDLTNKPTIQGVTLVGDKTFGALNFQAWSSANLKASDLNYDDATGSGGILPEYLNVGLKNTVALATTAVQEIIFNGESYTSTDGQPINLGYSVTTNNIVNKNYLDNSWFEINQRGTTSYPSVDSSIYICDRWKTITANKNRTIEIVDNGISIGTAPSDSAAKGINFGQIIGDDVWQSLSGKNLHASVEFRIDGITDFIISDWDCVCPIYHTNDPTGSQKQFYNLGSGTPSPGWGAKLYSVSEQLIFSIIWQGTSWDINDEYTDVPITIRRVKLEVSNYSTLKQEPKPIYLDELTKCQKYFRRYGGENYYSTGSVINVDNTDTVIGIGIARSKRILDITMHGLGDMESPFSVAMPTGVVLQARRGFRAATTNTYQPISVSVNQIKTYSYNPNVTNSTTLTEDFNFTYDSSTDTYTLATEYVANTSYFRKVYKKGLGNTLLATIDITSDASQYYPYYLVLPATASNAQEASWIQFSAEP